MVNLMAFPIFHPVLQLRDGFDSGFLGNGFVRLYEYRPCLVSAIFEIFLALWIKATLLS